MNEIRTQSPISAVNHITLQELRSSLTGDLVIPGDPDYDEIRRLWNGAVDKRPAVIVRCMAAPDVIKAVNFARTFNLPIAVRGGGHNAVGLALCDDGVVIDLSPMKQVQVDPARRVARAEPGLTIGEFTRILEPYGLLTPTGTCSGTGIAGSTLGGGIGWLTGKYGMAVDNVLALELVTAQGELVRASASENSELFWGLRGGGGNFGVVTAIEYRLHPVGKVLVGQVLYPRTNGPELLRFYRDFSSGAPDEIIAYCSLITLPEIGPAMVITACYCGEDLAEGERLLAPLRQAGTPLMEQVRPMNYTELIALLDHTAPDGRKYADTAYCLAEPSDDALDAMLACADTMTSPFSAIVIHHVNGAATRVAPDATAYALRVPHYAIVNSAAWEDGSPELHLQWTRTALARMRPFINLGLYVNFMGEGSESAIRDAYQGNYARLAKLKLQYDPTNCFRRNQNIKPTVAA